MKESDIQKIASSVMGQLTSITNNSTIKGCGGFSDTTFFACNYGFECASNPYLCGGASPFDCYNPGFLCVNNFNCYTNSTFDCAYGFTCNIFDCDGAYYCYPPFNCGGGYSL